MLTGPSSCQGEGASLTAGSTGEENPRGNDNKCEVFALNSSVIDTCVCVRLKALYMKQYKSIQPSLHYIGLSDSVDAPTTL